MVQKILSDYVYRGPPDVRHIPAICAGDIKSMRQELRSSPSSYPYGDYSWPVKGGFVHFNTANRQEKFPLSEELFDGNYGFPNHGWPTHWEESAPRMRGWKANGEDNYSGRENNAPIPKMPNLSYIQVVTPLGFYSPNKRDTQVKLKTTPGVVEAVDPNLIGLFESLAHNNTYSPLRKLLLDEANMLEKEAVEWIEFLAEKGYTYDMSKTIGVTALGVEKDVEGSGFLARYYPEKGYLTTEVDSQARTRHIMKHYGLDSEEAAEAMKKADLLHEIAHILGVPGSRASERLQGEFRAEFYTRRAERYKGTKMEKIYKVLAAEGRDYAQSHSILNYLLRELKADSFSDRKGRIELLVDKFAKEARALNKREDEINDYVEERISDTYGPLLKGKNEHESGPSGRTSARAENLERIVKKNNPGNNKISNSAERHESAGRKVYEANNRSNVYSISSKASQKNNAKTPSKDSKPAEAEAAAKEGMTHADSKESSEAPEAAEPAAEAA